MMLIPRVETYFFQLPWQIRNTYPREDNTNGDDYISQQK